MKKLFLTIAILLTLGVKGFCYEPVWVVVPDTTTWLYEWHARGKFGVGIDTHTFTAFINGDGGHIHGSTQTLNYWLNINSGEIIVSTGTSTFNQNVVITTLTATNFTITYATATNLNVTNLTCVTGTATDFVATRSTCTNLNSTNASITSLTMVTGTATDFVATRATCTYLNSTEGNITSLTMVTGTATDYFHFNNMKATGTIDFPAASLDGADTKNNEITSTQLADVIIVATLTVTTDGNIKLSTLTIGGETFTDIAGTGLTVTAGVLSVIPTTGTITAGTTNYNMNYWNGLVWTETDSLQNAGSGGVTTANRILISSSIGSGTPVADTIYADLLPKAVCNFNGQNTPAINYGVNISSITDLAAGQWFISFVIPFVDTNYVAMVSGEAGTYIYNTLNSAKTVSGVNVRCYDPHAAAPFDPIEINLVVFGNQ